MSIIMYLLWAILAIIIIISIWIVMQMLLVQPAFGQQSTKATAQGPDIRPISDKAYIISLGPNGEVQTIPVQQQPAVQSSGLGIPGLDVAAVLALVGTGVTYFKTHLVGKKTEKVEETAKENASMNVKQAIIQEEALKLQYENMGTEKANAITDKPEIRLTEVAKMKDQTVETATNS